MRTPYVAYVKNAKVDQLSPRERRDSLSFLADVGARARRARIDRERLESSPWWRRFYSKLRYGK
jgi:hypothetical protein